MYSTLELVIMGLIVMINLVGAIAILATIDKPRQYVRLGEGLRLAIMQLIVIAYLFWFGYLGRTMEVGELMTILTWSVVGWKMISFLSWLGTIENHRATARRTTGQVVWETISTMAQLIAVSLMFGLALAYGS